MDKENYRPVTIQIALNKVFEKLLLVQVTIGTSDCLSEYLGAYRMDTHMDLMREALILCSPISWIGIAGRGLVNLLALGNQ